MTSPSRLLSCAAVLVLCLLSLLSSTSADYAVSSLQETAYGWEGQLKMTTPGPYGDDIPTLSLSVWFETNARLRVTLRDATAKRWEIPPSFLSIPSTTPPTRAPMQALYSFNVTTNPFGFAITRRSTGRVLFNSSSLPLHYSDQFLQLGTTLHPNAPIYGLGERILPFRLPQEDMVIWDNDWGNPTLKNLYGHHPVYYSVEPTGTAHAVMLWNSNMMDVNLTRSSLTYKTIGGILDFYFLLGPSPLQLTNQYTEIVGRPWMPPTWALGWHQCKWGYSSANYTLQVVKNYTAADIPIDVIWNDIDWMRDYVAFTYNDEYGSRGYTHKDVQALNDYLAAHHQHHVQIVDPNIPAVLTEKDGTSYTPYVQGKARNIFVRHPANDTILFGKQWPPMTVAWPDWTNPSVVEWWTDNFRRFFTLAGPLSGVWLDMNEPSSFCAGQISHSCIGVNDSSRLIDPAAVPHAPGSWATDIRYPPYQPGKQWQGIEDHSFNISSHHYMGQHYNVKEFWGMMEQRATRLAMERLSGKRAFTLSRSTFMGSGKWGAHWLGDNDSDWVEIKQSIASVLSMGLYGVVMVGADICGFGGNTTPELCSRWIQLGALYPFARSHSSTGTRDQEAYRFGEPYTSINRLAIQLRYSLLPYYTSLYVEASEMGYPIWRPLMMTWPEDEATWGLDLQFMIGDALMGIPILDEGQDGVDGYLPNADWFNYFTYTRLTSFNTTAGAVGQNFSFCSSLSDTAHVPVIQRGGSIVYTQGVGSTTWETLQHPYTLRVAVDHTGHARGETSIIHPDELGEGPTGAPPAWRSQDTAELRWTAAAGLTGTFTHRLSGNSTYNITGQIMQALVVVGLDVAAGAKVPLPTLTVGGEKVPLTGVTVTVHNGAIVINDTSKSIFAVHVPMWTLTWSASQEAAEEEEQTVPAPAVRVASE